MWPPPAVWPSTSLSLIHILPLGYVMEWIYNLIPNYGWDIIIFTIVIRLLSIPCLLYTSRCV